MKRFLATFCFGLSCIVAFAQAPFTIVRPADGSRVREVVHVLIPKASVPPGGYIGIYAQGKFIEATVLPTDNSGKFYVYSLDTQARHLMDGPLTIEAVLFENYQDTPRIINRTKVTVTLKNSAANFLPDEGALLRYSWPTGDKYIYTVYQRNKVEEGTDAASQQGGRATSQSQDFQTFRYIYEVDNHYNNGDGLVRQQLLPLKGHNRLFLVVDTNTTPTYHNAGEAHAVFLRLTNTGLQRWGTVPLAVPMEGTSISGGYTDLFDVMTLPSLPFRRVSPGSSWASRFQLGVLDLAKLYDTNSVVQHFPMRGEFKDVEWMMGHPCAHIINTIAIGELSDEAKKAIAKNSATAVPSNKISVTQDVWFALDTHAVIKIRTVETVQAKANFQNNFGGNSGFGGPGGPGRPGGAGSGMPPPGIPGGPPGGMQGGPGSGADVSKPLGDMQIKGGLGRGMGVGGPGGPPGFGGFGRPGGGTGTTTTSGFIRIKRITTMVLNP